MGKEHVHIMGLGGVAMSAIARLLHDRGYVVSGCDPNPNLYTDAAQREGIGFAVGHSPDHLDGVDWVVITAAVAAEDPELVAARERGLRVLSRKAMVGELMRPHRSICVAGTHGKTTTCGMATVALTESGLDPSYLIGSQLHNYATNVHDGAGAWAVVEADEYDLAFLELDPTVTVVTNVELDHVDRFATRDEYRQAFHTFVARTAPDGLVVLCADDADAPSLAASAPCRVQTYGFAATADWRIVDFDMDHAGSRFTVATPGGELVALNIDIRGRHMIQNATGALAACVFAGLTPAQAAAGMGHYAGMSRRMDKLIDQGGIVVIDDYAHHPAEVVATVAAARALCHRKLRVGHEPYQRLRVESLLKEYVTAFGEADEACISEIYLARDFAPSAVSSKQIVAGAGGAAAGVYYAADLDAMAEWFISRAGAEEMWLLMGGGPITGLAHRLADWVRANR